MKHVFTMVLDSFGTGTTEDAECFGDVGADVLDYIAKACTRGKTNNGRKGPLNLPNLARLGPTKAHEDSTSFTSVGMNGNVEVIGTYVRTYEMSSGKDTPSGYWGVAGVPVLLEWEYSSDHGNSFLQGLLDKLVERANLPGYLGNCHSFSTAILDQLGKEYMKTDKPTSYTSADSVSQIACHGETFDSDKPYESCEITRKELVNGGHNTGHVITRSFVGDKAGNSQYTGNRHDLAIESPVPAVLQKLADEKHGRVVSVSKIVDIHANCGITKKMRTTGLGMLFDATTKEMKGAGNNTIAFTNFVDFDSSWGHRHNVAGYVAGLELFDRCLSELMSPLRDDGILIPTADHGCDLTWTGTDRTREHTPVSVYGPKVEPGSLDHHEIFADIGQTLTKYFDTSDMEYGKATF